MKCSQCRSDFAPKSPEQTLCPDCMKRYKKGRSVSPKPRRVSSYRSVRSH